MGGRLGNGRELNDEGLTGREALFVEHYAAQGFRGAGEAAGKAGYKSAGKQGPRILQRGSVAAAVLRRRDAVQAEVKAQGLLDRESLIELWSTIANNAQALDKDRIAASRLIALHLGLFVKEDQNQQKPRALVIVECTEGVCPRCGEVVRVAPKMMKDDDGDD